MDVGDLVGLMRCPSCACEKLALEAGTVVCSACGTALKVEGRNVFARAGHSLLSDEWERKQGESVERYLSEHYNERAEIPRIFGGFIATTLNPDDVVLDIGCGINKSLPIYASELSAGGYVGLEPLEKRVKRDYLCIVGAVAERLPIRNKAFDAILLATSLDHIEGVDEALGELKRVLSPRGRLYFWVGLQEPEVQARAKTFHPIFYGTTGWKRLLRIGAAYAEYAHFMWRMAKRKRALANGTPLDDAHFRYYTRASLLAELDRSGLDVRRTLMVPGSTAFMVEARPR
jgi:demethylmenaquinone methyltransferase/2-methoxy-6-polyprenyl-1,4-benzoquinol methylase